ncbi:MAG: hypothetical protein OEQ94_04940 [Nitrosopumilus sp.]|nr:hypothetical protein [Nitrosopumilus sp.]MDH3822780.1 hypothetical protein [Nitrosopumilus sp.]MDH3833735.1 hypothetical protein [Nitrosopumilus sp.]
MMNKIQVLLCSVLVILFFTVLDINFADAAKTGSYNFCTVFPAYPECTGYRTEALTDNYWFCEYVYLKNFCKNAPEPEKQIEIRTQDYCCRYIGPELQNTKTDDSQTISDQIILPTDTVESILPLIIWTDKDHYNYRDKVIVYGKFDFTNLAISQNIEQTNFLQTSEVSEKTFDIDIKLNGRVVLRDIPVSPNGWFSAFFSHDNIYNFSTQNNLLEVDYIVTGKNMPLGGPKTHATYHFTTGDIAKNEESFKIWIDKTSLPNKIEYGVIVKNPDRFIELFRSDLVTTRLITPEGYVIPIESGFSIQNTATEYKGFKEFGQGVYAIQITYGNNTAKEIFEYVN